MSDFAQTAKQTEIAEHVLAAADKSHLLTFAELRARLSYAAGVSKQTVLCSLKLLEIHGIVRRVYGPERGPFRKGVEMRIEPTADCYARFRR